MNNKLAFTVEDAQTLSIHSTRRTVVWQSDTVTHDSDCAAINRKDLDMYTQNCSLIRYSSKFYRFLFFKQIFWYGVIIYLLVASEQLKMKLLNF